MIAELMMQQVEFADVIVINKIDLVDEYTISQIEGVVARSIPIARL